jgi:hypothetical protein
MCPAAAQQSMFESSNGETSIFLASQASPCSTKESAVGVESSPAPAQAAAAAAAAQASAAVAQASAAAAQASAAAAQASAAAAQASAAAAQASSAVTSDSAQAALAAAAKASTAAAEALAAAAKASGAAQALTTATKPSPTPLGAPVGAQAGPCSALGVILYNFSSSTGRFGYLHQKSGATTTGFGFDISGTLKDNAVSIVHSNATAPGISLRASVVKGLKRWSALDIKPNAPPTFKCTVCSEWLVFQVRYDVSQFYTVPTSVPPYPLPTKQTFNGVQGKVGYNALLKSSNADFLLGITVGVGELNNTASLTSAQYSNNQITESGTNQLVINQGQKTLYVGKYKTYLGVPINFDAIIFPGALSGMVGIDLFVRSNVTAPDLYGNPGVGLFFSKKNQPARPIGGITGSYANGKGQASIVAGWTF